MPVTRSMDNLSNLGENVSFTVDVGPSGSSVVTRSQERSKSATAKRGNGSNSETNDIQIRRIISESLVSFREEMMSIMTSEFTNMCRGIQLPTTTNNSTDNADNVRNTPSNSDFRIPQDPFYAEKVLNIIRNWRLKFTGHNNEMTIDEFIYRTNMLTTNNLGGDFELLCKHAHTLFEGKALEWYWRYHRHNNYINWNTLTTALRVQYKSDYNDFDILDDIRRRRQKPNESFDDYFDIISSMIDKLKSPISDHDLCETILRNLKTEIRHELLHIDISSVSQLRKEVRKHEKFIKDFHALEYKKTNKGRVAEINSEQIHTLDGTDEDSNNICAVQHALICWNCDKPDHTYFDCMEQRRVFCYGCGAKDVYKPTCPKCSKRAQGNAQKDVRRF